MRLQSDLPLAPAVLRNLSDRQYEKRKLAALEIETRCPPRPAACVPCPARTPSPAGGVTVRRPPASSSRRIKELMIAGGEERHEEFERIMIVLGRDYAQSNLSNYRKGGLIGLAAAALGLADEAHRWLHLLLPPVLSCFTDQDSRVRYYACEALYNVAKVTRTRVVAHFNQIFDALCRISADLDPAVKNGAQLLDRLLKDVVAESTAFPVDSFIPLLRQHLEHANCNIRHALIGWIVALDSVPHVDLQVHILKSTLYREFI
jgi:vacuole morphology and inheritance protein 14